MHSALAAVDCYSGTRAKDASESAWFFMYLFIKGCELDGIINDKHRKVYLEMKLTGIARLWIENIYEEMKFMSFESVRRKFLRTFDENYVEEEEKEKVIELNYNENNVVVENVSNCDVILKQKDQSIDNFEKMKVEVTALSQESEAHEEIDLAEAKSELESTGCFPEIEKSSAIGGENLFDKVNKNLSTEIDGIIDNIKLKNNPIDEKLLVLKHDEKLPEVPVEQEVKEIELLHINVEYESNFMKHDLIRIDLNQQLSEDRNDHIDELPKKKCKMKNDIVVEKAFKIGFIDELTKEILIKFRKSGLSKFNEMNNGDDAIYDEFVDPMAFTSNDLSNYENWSGLFCLNFDYLSMNLMYYKLPFDRGPNNSILVQLMRK